MAYFPNYNLKKKLCIYIYIFDSFLKHKFTLENHSS